MPLRRLLGHVATADAVLTMDGAITHCSVALGTPTLALFGPTIPTIWFPYARYGPYRVLHAGVDCSLCDRYWCPTKACMGAISVQSAAESLEEIASSGRHEGDRFS
jgi:ADP-heptose:LPS heptosyltransferase